ncbi:hypothetical protein [Nitrosopumilus sp.]|uniref:hypothetical protein n=1 Tax=Nitrosopumilus sp. TaxID=2024843 RepID=UPI00292FD724|nr:hypothetical protein [Nitrosopumilus sp.]
MSILYNNFIYSPSKNRTGHNGLRVGGSCRGICPRYAITTKWGQKKYDLGLQFCSYCRIWFDHQDNRLCCICCGKRLQYKRRNKNNRHSKREMKN